MNLKDILAIVFLIACFTFLFGRKTPAWYYGYDEADYMKAASKGFRANYLDEGTVGWGVFIKKAISLGFDFSNRDALSQFIRSSEDVSFFRHYHGPVYFYWLTMIRAMGGAAEQVLRFSSMILWLLTVLTCYVGCVAALPTQGRLTGFIAAACLMFSRPHIDVAMMITPHNMFNFISLLSLFSLARWFQTYQTGCWYAAVLFATIATLSIENGIFLFLTLFLCLMSAPSDKFGNTQKIKLLKRAGITAFLLILIVWPAAIFKMSLLRSFLFYAYFATIRRHTYGSHGFAELWIFHFLRSPIFNFLILIGILSFILWIVKQRGRDNEWLWACPFGIFSFFCLVVTFLNRSLNPTYISPFLSTVYLLASWGLVQIVNLSKDRLRMFFAIVIPVIFFAGNYPPVSSALLHAWPAGAQRTKQIIEFLKKSETGREKVLAPHELKPTLGYYFPNLKTSYYYSDKEIASDLFSQDYHLVIVNMNHPDNVKDKMEESLKRRHLNYTVQTSDGLTFYVINIAPSPDAGTAVRKR